MKTPILTWRAGFLSGSTSPFFPGDESTLPHWIRKRMAFHDFKDEKRKLAHFLIESCALFQIEYKLNSMQMKFLRLLSKSAFQEMRYSCAASQRGKEDCMVDVKGENEAIVNNLEKINLNVTEVRLVTDTTISHDTLNRVFSLT